MFEQDGTAKYYNNNRYPLDMHSVSQAVFTLLKVGKTPDDFILAEKVINRAIKTLYMPKNQRFIYQKISILPIRLTMCVGHKHGYIIRLLILIDKN
nr:hypothetical protein [Ningiella sp. W23]